MSFIETVERARTLLERNSRLSLRALQREFELDDDALEMLVEELVDVQQVAAREGKALSWVGPAAATPSAEPEAPAAAQAAEAERRQLTVMFCDLVGSTDLAQRLDAEDLRDVVLAYQKSAASAVERYAGHIAQYLGDGLLVYFGYPRAHEDDAERAVRAGREILGELGGLNERLEREYGIRLAVRIGIHTGGVVVGEIGSGARHETLALGDPINVASRLQGVAESDSVVISEATLRLVPGVFLVRDLGSPALKGIAEPIRAYAVLQATGVSSRLDVDPSRLTPLVGRDREVDLILSRWKQAEAGQGQAVLICGEAGLGKSRLLQAFRGRLGEATHGWLECHCSPYTQGSAFHPLIELLEQGLGFREGDDPAAKLSRLEGGVEGAALAPSEVVPLVAPLLSLALPDDYPPLPISPELQRKRTIEALVAWVLALGKQQPVVMLFEDLHWSDPSTVELLELLLEQSQSARVLTLLTYRPEFEPPWSPRPHLTRVPVERLSRQQAESLVAGMTRDLPLPAQVVERIVAQADGIPLYVEELTKMVLESDVVAEQNGRYELTGELTELAIPTTLQDSLMARLDRLVPGKEVAQLGAAIGREFFYELMRTISPFEDPILEAGLRRLVDVELLYQRGSPPHATYTFKHALIQETAYQSLLKGVRQEFHGRIAKALEERFPGRVESEPEVIARHYAEAGLVEQAIRHYQRAGERATERAADEEAIAHFRKGISLLAGLPESSARKLQELMLQVAVGSPLMAVKGYSSPEVERAYARARELSQEAGDAPQLFRALWGLAAFYQSRSELGVAREIADQLLELAEGTGDSSQRLLADLTAGATSYYEGHWSLARERLRKTVALYDPSEHRSLAYVYGQDPGMIAAVYAGICAWHLGQPDAGLREAQEAVDRGRRARIHPLGLAFGLDFLGLLHYLRREGQAVRACAEESIPIAQDHGFVLELGLARMLRGWALTDAGSGDEGVELMQQGLAELGATGVTVGAPGMLGLIADGQQRAGRLDDAMATTRLALDYAKQQSDSCWEPQLRRLYAELLLQCDPPGRELASRQLRESLDLARSQGSRLFELRAATSVARLLAERGQRAEARALLQPVYDGFTEGFDMQDLKDAKALLEELA